MPRIRTIKPDFWTDSKVVRLTPAARLLFIGMWNFADDHGGIEADEVQLKLRIFPADSLSIQPLLTELITHGLLTEYSVNGCNYLHIKGFRTHQIINRPSKPRCPPYHSLNTHGGKGSGSGLGSGREEEKKDLKTGPVETVDNSHADDGANGSGVLLGATPEPAPRSAYPDQLLTGTMTGEELIKSLEKTRKREIADFKWRAKPEGNA